MSTIRRVNFCRDIEHDRDRVVIWFTDHISCFRIKPDDDTEMKQCLIVADEDGCNPICRIDFFSDFEPDEEE